jgi:hypothetical protein
LLPHILLTSFAYIVTKEVLLCECASSIFSKKYSVESLSASTLYFAFAMPRIQYLIVVFKLLPYVALANEFTLKYY